MHTENGARAVLANIGVLGKGSVAASVVQDHGFPSTQNELHDALRVRVGSSFPPAHDESIAADGRFGRDALLASAGEYQQAAFCPGVLNRGAHQYVDELVENHFTGDGLGDFEDGRKIQALNGRIDGARGGGQLVLG